MTILGWIQWDHLSILSWEKFQSALSYLKANLKSQMPLHAVICIIKIGYLSSMKVLKFFRCLLQNAKKWVIIIENVSMTLWRLGRHMSFNARKPVFGGLWPTKAQTSLHILGLISTFDIHYLESCYKRNINFLASLCSWVAWFESYFLRHPEDRFSRIAAHILDFVNYCISTKAS